MWVFTSTASSDATGIASVCPSRSTHDIAAVDGYRATAATSAAADACRPAAAVRGNGAAVYADGANAATADACMITTRDVGNNGSARTSVLGIDVQGFATRDVNAVVSCKGFAVA